MSDNEEEKERQALLAEISTKRLPVNELYPINAFFKVEGYVIESRKLSEISDLIWLPDGIDDSERHARIIRAIELFESLEPKDAAESMLAAQMVGTHGAALECLRRAAIPSQTFQGRDMALKHAHKLMSLYTQQLATLNKYRGKGQQKVTVEHVTVEPGGQAIVGNVEAGQAGSRQNSSEPFIEHAPEVPIVTKRPKAKTSKTKRSG